MPGGSARSLSRLRSRLRSCARTPETASTKARTETETRAAECIMGDGHEYTQDGEGRHSVGWPPDLLDAGGCSRRMGPARLIVGRHSEHEVPRAERGAVRGSSSPRHGGGNCRGERRRGAAAEKDGAGACHAFRACGKVGFGPAASLAVQDRPRPLCQLQHEESGIRQLQQGHGPVFRRATAMQRQLPFPVSEEREIHPSAPSSRPSVRWSAAVSGLPASRTPSRRTQVPLDAPGWNRLEKKPASRIRV